MQFTDTYFYQLKGGGSGNTSGGGFLEAGSFAEVDCVETGLGIELLISFVYFCLLA